MEGEGRMGPGLVVGIKGPGGLGTKLPHKGPGKESGWLILGGAVLGLVPALLLKPSEGWEPSSHKWTLGTALGKTDTASLY